jgi:hypothetical protein
VNTHFSIWRTALFVVAPLLSLVAVAAQGPPTAPTNLRLGFGSSSSGLRSGIWVNVTPPSWNPDPNYPRSQSNFGFQQVLVDPARPSDLYTFTDYQGVWRSTDYGMTWTMISTGTNSDGVNKGRNWAAVIAMNPSGDASMPPMLYTQAGYSNGGTMGIWKSIDGGVNWTYVWNTVLAADGSTNITAKVWTDMQGLSIDPGNSQHLLAVNHGNTQGGAYDNHIFETTNGGASWIDRGNPAGTIHCAVSMITSTAWIATAEGWGPGSRGTFVTNDAGASWNSVGQMGKAHGTGQIYYVDHQNDRLYLAAMEGIFTATSPYTAWSRLDATTTQNVIGTPNFLYASYAFASLGAVTPKLRRATAADDVSWIADYTPTPIAMTNGAMGSAVTFDAATGRNVVVTANGIAGLWRYIE